MPYLIITKNIRAKGKNSGNSHNEMSPKVVKGEFGQTEIAIPRDRFGTFELQLIQPNTF
jgi:transposase-like protein